MKFFFHENAAAEFERIVDQADPYFLELVRYIHLNPLCAKLELRRNKADQQGDERIFGDSDFMEEVLRRSEEKFTSLFLLQAQ